MINHPSQLPQFYRDLWNERAAIIQAGCNLPTDRDGTAEANRRAFRDVLAVMGRDEDESMRQAAARGAGERAIR